MRYFILGWIFVIVVFVSSFPVTIHAVDETVSSNTKAEQPSLGNQAGETARELKEKAEVAGVEIAETSQKVQAQAQDVFKDLQKKWEVFSQQMQASFQQFSAQLKQQQEDFQKSFDKTPPS